MPWRTLYILLKEDTDRMINWKTSIGIEMKIQGESWEDVESCTLSEEELNVVFDNGYGGKEGKPFTLWTKKRVYFPVCYDGSEWTGSVSRNPDGKSTEHLGGG